MIGKNTGKNIVDATRYSIISLVTIIASFLLDRTIINIVMAIQYPVIFDIFYIVTLLGELYIFIWIALFFMIALLINNKKISTFVFGVGTAIILNTLIKLTVMRPRPFEVMHMSMTIDTTLSSFPSGHAMMFFSMMPVLSKNFPKIKIVIWIIAILLGLSRIYLGAHYLSDVIAGAALGYGIGWIFMKTGERYAWKY